jgi:hypothetical protein
MFNRSAASVKWVSSLTEPSLFELSVELTDTKDDYRYHRPAIAKATGISRQIFERTLALGA